MKRLVVAAFLAACSAGTPVSSSTVPATSATPPPPKLDDVRCLVETGVTPITGDVMRIVVYADGHGGLTTVKPASFPWSATLTGVPAGAPLAISAAATELWNGTSTLTTMTVKILANGKEIASEVGVARYKVSTSTVAPRREEAEE